VEGLTLNGGGGGGWGIEGLGSRRGEFEELGCMGVAMFGEAMMKKIG